MLAEIFALDKRLAIANHRLHTQFPDHAAIEQFIDDYLQAYAHFNRLDTESILAHNNHFARIYARHLEEFAETGLYPLQTGDTTLIDRLCYDIALILSCVTSPARHAIARCLYEAVPALDQRRVCVVGAGAGIELALLQRLALRADVTAFDFAFNDFLRTRFAGYTLCETDFLDADATPVFDVVLAIELLEHVEHHEKILQKALHRLTPGGQLICTTATNMPQFDHRYNFVDLDAFKDSAQAIGFAVREHRTFHEPHAFHRIDSRNDWFVLEKS